jgi:MFS family permease
MFKMQPTLSPRSAVTAVFFSFGAAIGSMAGSMPSVMRSAGMSSEILGLGLTVSTITTVAAMALGGKIARYASNRAVLLAVLPVFAVSMFAYLVAQSPLWFFLAVLPMGFCFGLTDLFMNAEAVAIEHDMRRPVFMTFHGAVSAGVAIVSVLASYLSTMLGAWATGAFAVLLFAVTWLLVHWTVEPRPLARGKAARLVTLPNKLPLTLLGIAAGLIIAAETTALLWSAKLLDERAPSLAAIAGLGAAFFGLCNAAMRFPGDALRSQFGDMKLMIVSLLVSIAGFIALGLSASFVSSVAAFAAVGLGLALLIPCIFSMAAGLVPENRAGALSYVSLLTALPRCAAPGVFGLIAAGFGISTAFGLVALALTSALGLIGYFGSRRACR